MISNHLLVPLEVEVRIAAPLRHLCLQYVNESYPFQVEYVVAMSVQASSGRRTLTMKKIVEALTAFERQNHLRITIFRQRSLTSQKCTVPDRDGARNSAVF